MVGVSIASIKPSYHGHEGPGYNIGYLQFAKIGSTLYGSGNGLLFEFDVATNAYTLDHTIDTASTDFTNAIASDGTNLFTACRGSADALRSWSTATSPPTEVGSISLGGASEVVLDGNYAYVASTDNPGHVRWLAVPPLPGPCPTCI